LNQEEWGSHEDIMGIYGQHLGLLWRWKSCRFLGLRYIYMGIFQESLSSIFFWRLAFNLSSEPWLVGLVLYYFFRLLAYTYNDQRL
jgi:hypothetical protein